MRIIGVDGCQLIVIMTVHEYKKWVNNLAGVDDDDSEEN